MEKRKLRERLRKRRQRDRLRAGILGGGITILALTMIGTLLWSAFRPAAGQALSIMPSRRHVELGEDPGAFTSDPPTSGPHYGAPLDPGFYDEAAAAEISPFPAGHLVHNLEHGYVLFWYNCAILDEAECMALKSQLREVTGDANTRKIISFPWPSIDVPVVATSWGRMQEFESFDAKLARRFVRANRNRAPEPHAP
jgi:hypothetical protein